MKLLNLELLKHNVEKRICSDLNSNIFFGASVIVSQSGNVIYKNNFGSVSLDNDKAVDGNTIYRLASMTKPITAVAVMCLVDEGLLDLNDPIEKYIPGYKDLKVVSDLDEEIKLISSNVKPTIKHLLTHTSGIGSAAIGNEQYAAMSDFDKSTIKNTVDYFSEKPLAFEPGASASYCAFASFDILAYIVEKLSGEKYGEFLRKHIFEPCEMYDTAFEPTLEQWGRMIEMHNREDGKNVIGKTYPECIFERFPSSHHLAGAGLISTLDNYHNFAKMLLNYGEFNGKKILSKNAVKLMTQHHVDEKIQQGSQRWGLGMRVITGENTLPIGSYGWSGAYGTHFWIDPENQIIGIYMKNSRYDGGSNSVTAANFEKDVYNSL